MSLHVVLHRTDPTRNMARYYVLSIEASLFGDAALVRQWGRVGSKGRFKIELFADREAAVQTLEDWLDRKIARGYHRS